MRKYFVVLSGVLIAAASAVASENSYHGPALRAHYEGPLLVDNSQLRYTGQDRLTFFAEDYLREHLPHLLPLRTAIDG
ncbi:MAG: hypothetical protein AAFY88_11755, partial [Acidobacteriota bacterium]